MVTMPVWAFVLVVGLMPLVGLVSYFYGWKLRDRLSRHDFQYRENFGHGRPMTTEEQARFNRAFDHMRDAFDELKP